MNPQDPMRTHKQALHSQCLRIWVLELWSPNALGKCHCPWPHKPIHHRTSALPPIDSPRDTINRDRRQTQTQSSYYSMDHKTLDKMGRCSQHRLYTYYRESLLVTPPHQCGWAGTCSEHSILSHPPVWVNSDWHDLYGNHLGSCLYVRGAVDKYVFNTPPFLPQGRERETLYYPHRQSAPDTRWRKMTCTTPRLSVLIPRHHSPCHCLSPWIYPTHLVLLPTLSQPTVPILRSLGSPNKGDAPVALPLYTRRREGARVRNEEQCHLIASPPLNLTRSIEWTSDWVNSQGITSRYPISKCIRFRLVAWWGTRPDWPVYGP